MSAARDQNRKRGNIEERGGALRVRLYAGTDPVTGKQVYYRDTIQGTNKAAWKKAENKLAEFQAKVAKQRSAQSSVNLAYALSEWMRTNELANSTRKTYEGYIDRTIVPALGETPVNKLSARILEGLYTELRRCRNRCNGKPFVVHKRSGEHDCEAAGCKPHECKPMETSTVRQIHAIISGTLDAAERWEWIDTNPARVARKPKQKRPEPDPPSPAEAARLSEEAFRMDDDWGTLVWLAMTTGARRGELVGLRFSHVDLEQEVIALRRNWVLGEEKDTKAHQIRRIAVDSETVTLLREHRERVRLRVESLGRKFTADLFVFTGTKTPDHVQPYPPNAVTQRYKDMADRLNLDTNLHALRHYSATELLTAGVDLPTVSGRLGHGGGGATTLRVYAAWVAASDRKAAEILGSRLPKRHGEPS
ncbi:tyrosine-type recombinase/integrase [Saccharopolyspora aridisoli]|nr:site-specific integrase [Saccharopolyspora aridisoli]